jgi:hypothetical protein
VTTATTPRPCARIPAGRPQQFRLRPRRLLHGPQGNPACQRYGSSDFALCSQNWAPPMHQPQQKSYLDYNGGWPVGSWPITEPSTGYQAKYVLLLPALAR